MSLKTWKKEFYPKEAIDAIKTELMATKHSLRKWRGLTKANLKKHGLVQTGDFIHKKNNFIEKLCIDDSSCALCCFNEDSSCEPCILYKVRGKESCGSQIKDENQSPFDLWKNIGNPTAMIQLLKQAIKKLTMRGSEDENTKR